MLPILIGAFPAFAQDMSAYIGVGVGAFDHDNREGGAFSDTVSSVRLYGGLQVSRHFGFEIGRGSTSELQGGPSGSPLTVGVRHFTTAHRVDFTTTTIKAVGYVPFDWGALWLGYGWFRMDADVDFTNGATGGSISVDDEDEVAALGLEWRIERSFDRSIDLRLEYEWLGFPFSDASTIAIGVGYRFGGL